MAARDEALRVALDRALEELTEAMGDDMGAWSWGGIHRVTFAGPRGETRKTTDTTGSFTFEGSPGRYTITAKAGGKSKSIQAEVKDERLELPPLILE